VADPAQDIYEMLDRAGLVSSNILTPHQSTAKTVLQIRERIVKEFTNYIQERERNDGHRTEIQVSQPED
jgi:hypothetical protein